MSLHSASSVNGEGSTPKDPLYKILDDLRSLKLCKEKQERKQKDKNKTQVSTKTASNGLEYLYKGYPRKGIKPNMNKKTPNRQHS